MMSAFPDDVIADILSRLPVKPLLRFRSVSKPWHALIDSPVFIKLHLNKTKKLQAHRKLIRQGNYSDLYTVDFDGITKTNIADVVAAPHPFGTVCIVNCCNGLVCMSIPNGSGIAIWNPSTRRHQILPDFDCGPLPSSKNLRSKCHWFCGFGYDVLSDDYKVVVIKKSDVSENPSLSSQVNVYSLKMNSWRQIKPFPYCLKYGNSSGQVVSGALHCIVGQIGEFDIAAFDLATEEYSIVPQPDYPENINFNINLETLGGCLSVTWEYYREYIDIWVLKEYGKQDSWTKITRMKVSAFSGSAFGCMRTVEYSVTEKELILGNGRINSMVRYDIEKKLVKDVEIRGQRNHGSHSDIYEESLVQLKNGDPWKEVENNSKKIEKPQKSPAKEYRKLRSEIAQPFLINGQLFDRIIHIVWNLDNSLTHAAFLSGTSSLHMASSWFFSKLSYKLQEAI